MLSFRQTNEDVSQAGNGTASGQKLLGRRLALLTMAGLVMVCAIWLVRNDRPADLVAPASRAKGGPLIHDPLLPDSPFLNVRGAGYVGSRVCGDCHAEEYDAYRRTGMGRSLARVTPEDEPADGRVDHAASQRSYQVFRQDGKLWHRELLRTGGPEEVLLAEHPLAYVVGSGRHARTYLAEIDGFMVESPISWYESRRAWDMSPGYDKPAQQGFERQIPDNCLLCHAGASQAVDGTFHRMQIDEEWISCERCHGPGSLHVEKWQGAEAESRKSEVGVQRPQSGTPLSLNPQPSTPNPQPFDDTIVNQRHLSRELSEAICAQCHLIAEASVPARGRRGADFRPGLLLSAFRADFALEETLDDMTVVGHMLQMRRSRCYQASQMTCTTCHNPHHDVPVEERTDYYRQACLECHQTQACRVDPAERERRSPINDCVHCHMPRSETDVPHVAFTHHGIGVHAEDGPSQRPAASGPSTSGRLVPISDLSVLSPWDQQRCLGLAHHELVRETAHDQKRQQAHLRAASDLLWKARQADVQDPELDAALSELAASASDPRAEELARRVLAAENVEPRVRMTALAVMANWHAERGEFDQAVRHAQELNRLWRSSADAVLLGRIEGFRGNEAGMIAAYEQALLISPMRVDLRQEMITYYRSRRDENNARRHQRLLPRQSPRAAR